MRGPGTRAARTAALVVVTLAVAACGHSGAKPVAPTGAASEETTALLARSRAVVDAAPAVHFILASRGVAGSSTVLTGGSGDLVRPDELTGSFDVGLDGLNASVDVVEVGGRFYAQPPFASHFSVTNPATYGLGDPAGLLDARTGVSTLLTSMSGPHAEGQQRIAGERLDVIGGTIPGRLLPVLPDLQRSVPVGLTAFIDPQSGQLRRFVLTGPFTKAGVTTTYTVTLSDYGEHVHVTAPPT